MFDPSTMTVSQVISALRDIGFLIGMIYIGWNARSIVQPLLDLFKQAKSHLDRSDIFMTKMEISMSTLLMNHLKHIEADLKTLSGRKDASDK